MELALELDDWWVTLKNGSVLHLRAHAYSQVADDIVFSVLVKGTPNMDVPLAHIPAAIVDKVRGG